MAKPGPGFEDEPSVFDVADTEADERATLEGEADIAAGRLVSQEAVERWLHSWGTDKPLPPPKCGE